MNTQAAWKWTEEAFQAMTYWLGYQRKRFRHYPIREIDVMNVGRDPITDEPALEAKLESGHVFSAALDVFENLCS